MGDPKNGPLSLSLSPLHVPLCLAGEASQRFKAAKKPPARFYWHLASLLTGVARETVAKGVWATARPESPHTGTQWHARIFLSPEQQLTMTEFATSQMHGRGIWGQI